MVSDNVPAPDEIRKWIATLDQKDADLQARIEPLAREQIANRDRRRLLTDLLSSYQDAQIQTGTGSVVNLNEPIGIRVRRQVREILEESSEPMHINDIHAAFIHRGFEVPGQGRPANVTTHLGGDGEIVSPRRGYYALKSRVGEVEKRPTATRKTRRRKR